MPGNSFDWQRKAVPLHLWQEKKGEERRQACPVLTVSYQALFQPSYLWWKEPQVSSLVFSWKGPLEFWSFLETKSYFV